MDPSSSCSQGPAAMPNPQTCFPALPLRHPGPRVQEHHSHTGSTSSSCLPPSSSRDISSSLPKFLRWETGQELHYLASRLSFCICPQQRLTLWGICRELSSLWNFRKGMLQPDVFIRCVCDFIPHYGFHSLRRANPHILQGPDQCVPVGGHLHGYILLACSEETH